MNDLLLQEVWEEFNDRLSQFGTVVIAGGAVRDALMNRTAKDYDVFILQGASFDFKATRPAVVAALSDLRPLDPIVDWHRSEPFLATSVQWPRPDKQIQPEVQVLVSPCADIHELLNSFDWNICLFGYANDTTTMLEVTSNIAPGKPLKLHKITYPLSTLRRGFRFSERFKMKLERATVLELCGAIMKGATPSPYEEDHAG